MKYTRIVAGIIFFSAISSGLFAGWSKTYGVESGDNCWWIEITSEGYAACGASLIDNNLNTTPGIEARGFLLRANKEGDSLLMNLYNISRPPLFRGCQFYNFQKTSDDGYVFTGYGEGKYDDVIIFKTNQLGDSLWSNQFEWESYNRGWFIQETSDGGYVITGVNGATLEHDLFVLRTDSTGDSLWTFIYGEPEDDEWAKCVRQVSDGNYVIAGFTRTDGVKRAHVFKIDDEQNIIWDKYYSNPQTEFTNVIEIEDGSLVLTGDVNDKGGILIMHLDENGDSLWSNFYTGSFGYSVEKTFDGGFIIAGVKSFSPFPPLSDGVLYKLDSLGGLMWERNFMLTQGGDNQLTCVHQTQDSGYIIGGITGTSGSEKAYEIWLIKTDSQGIVGIDEIDNPVSVEQINTVTSQVTLKYENLNEGFHAQVFDASGRLTDEIHNKDSSGTISWGQGQKPGVYFIKELSGKIPVRKVILVR